MFFNIVCHHPALNVLCQERHMALKQMGVSVQSSGIRLDNSRHYLVNLNADPSLNELLVYYLEVCSVKMLSHISLCIHIDTLFVFIATPLMRNTPWGVAHPDEECCQMWSTPCCGTLPDEEHPLGRSTP